MVCVPFLENRTSIKFLALGDWGGVPLPPYITPVEKATALEMGRVAEQMGADFVLALGDNFYYKGVDSVDSPRFQVSPGHSSDSYCASEKSLERAASFVVGASKFIFVCNFLSGHLRGGVYGKLSQHPLVYPRWQSRPCRECACTDRVQPQVRQMVSIPPSTL